MWSGKDEKSLRVGATEFSKKESFVARNGGFCIFAAVQAHQPATVHELPDGRRLEAVSWIGGLHHSYRWAV